MSQPITSQLKKIRTGERWQKVLSKKPKVTSVRSSLRSLRHLILMLTIGSGISLSLFSGETLTVTASQDMSVNEQTGGGEDSSEQESEEDASDTAASDGAESDASSVDTPDETDAGASDTTASDTVGSEPVSSNPIEIGSEESAPQQQDDVSDSRLDELLKIQSARLAYNGEILAEQRIDVVSEASGMVISVNVEVGQVVNAGDPLAKIDSTILEAQTEQAKASLEAAQAQLELLMEPASEDEIEAAQATLDAAEATYNQLLQGPEPEDVRIAQAELKQAEAAVTVAQAAYNQVRGNPQIAALPQSLELQRTTLQLEAAQASYEKLFKSSTPNQIANALSQVVSARTELARLKEGPKPAEIRINEAQIKQAETALFLAQLALDKATVRAPINGVIAKVAVTPGAMAGTGDSVAVILSPDMKVTIPVEEYRLSVLELGQPAVIRVDAYPDQLVEGTVTVIAPELNSETRTVEVTIRPVAEGSTLLRPGMFATVDLLELAD